MKKSASETKELSNKGNTFIASESEEITEVKKIIDEFHPGPSEIPYLPDKYFPALKIFSDNPDCFVRSAVAALLVNFETEESKQILIRLAQDKENIVRYEAYDSLSIFDGDEEVQLFFEKSISKERDEFARFYAITSWTDITVSKEDVSEDIRFIRRVRKVQKTDWGKLACWYALYLFGEESGFKKFLKFLQSRDWKIRLSTLYLLENPIRFQDFSEKQLITIKRKLKELLKQELKQEPFVQVRKVAEELIHLIDTGEEIDS